MGSGALKMYGRYVRAGKKVLQRERERQESLGFNCILKNHTW